MARKIYILGIFTMATACGVIGYQVLTYYFYADWPIVPFDFVIEKTLGKFPTLAWPWANDLWSSIGKLPTSAVCFIMSYSLLLLSDLLRGDARRRAS
jgi:hypothetical protein